MPFVPAAQIIKPYCNSGAEVAPPLNTSTTVANQETGFPPLQATPLGSGGIPVDIEQFNGVLKFYSAQSLNWCAGVQPTFDQNFSTLYGGYPAGIILYAASNNSYQLSLVANNTANFITTPSYLNDGINWSDFELPPTIQKFTSGSGTYTLPTTPRKPKYIRVQLCGGGGGGSGGVNGGAGVTGGNTTFGSSLLTATGGGGATSILSFGAGGTATIAGGAVGNAINGQSGQSGSFNSGATGISAWGAPGGHGGQNFFAGAGYGGTGGTTSVEAYQNAIANTGGGGGGGGFNSFNPGAATNAGAGGGGGAYIDAIIYSPSSTYAYAIGTGGSGGTAGGGNAQPGGAGAAGIIIVTEYY